MESRWLQRFVVLVVFSVSLIIRVGFAATARHPGHGDQAFYYTVAENVVDGRGFQIDYVWNYMNDPKSVTHSSLGFWMPLTSAFISLSLLVAGKSLFAALLPSILFGLALSGPAYFLGKAYSDSRLVAMCSAGLVLFVPHLFGFSLVTDSPIYYAFFVSLGLLFMLKGRTSPQYFLVSAACAGLAHLTRQDGVLLFLTLVTVIVLSPLPRRIRAAYLLLGLGIYLLILLPVIIENERIFGSPFPPGPSKMMFLTHYEDHYSYSKELNLQTYLAWGIPAIVRSKIGGLFVNARVLYRVLPGSFVRVFALVGTLDVLASSDKRQEWAKYFPPFLFLTLLFAFYAFVVTVGSGATGFTRSSLSLIPFLVVTAVDAVNRNLRSRAVVLLIVALIGLSSSYNCVRFAQEMIGSNNQMGERLGALREVLDSEVHQRDQQDVVIMTRNPWEVYHSTRYRAIQIPNDDLDTICDAARRFGADYLLLPAPRKALEGIYLGDKVDERFLYVAKIPGTDMKLFRINLDE